jgi:hypothetical protein
MPGEHTQFLADYVASGNTRVVDSALSHLSGKNRGEIEKKFAEIRQNRTSLVTAFRESGTPPPQASSEPGDFRAALTENNQVAYERDLKRRGIEVRQPDTNNKLLKTVPALARLLESFYKGQTAVKSLPSPGGLGLILLVILAFFLILVPATSAGETRALLLWDVLLGKKVITKDTAPAGSSSSNPNYEGAVIAGALGGTGEGVVQALTGESPQQAIQDIESILNALGQGLAGGLIGAGVP